MKQKKHSILLAICIGLAAFPFSACFAEDYVPKTWGEWDGNYIYCGNVKSKTTGEEAQTLVESFEANGVTYTVGETKDYDVIRWLGTHKIANDCVYLPFVCQKTPDEKGQKRYETVVVEYSMKEKSSRTLYVDETGEFTGEKLIVAVLDEYLVIQSDETIAVDLDGGLAENVTLPNVVFDDIARTFADKYTLYYDREDENIKLVDWGNPEDVATVVKHEYGQNYIGVEQDGRVGVLVYETGRAEVVGTPNTESREYLVEFKYFDAQTRTLSDVEGIADVRKNGSVDWVDGQEGEYFVSFIDETVSYDYGPVWDREKKTVVNSRNCALWKMEYGEDGASASKIFAFGKDKSYRNVDAVWDDKAYVRSLQYTSTSGCDRGGTEYRDYVVDMKKGKYKRYSDGYFDEKEKAYMALGRKKGVTFGEYTYFIRFANSAAWLGDKPDIGILARFNGKKTETMQVWGNGKQEKLRYCKEMWGQYGVPYTAVDFAIWAD